jgi:hypothetical protein
VSGELELSCINVRDRPRGIVDLAGSHAYTWFTD